MTDPIQLPIFSGDPEVEGPQDGMLAWDSVWKVPLVHINGHWTSFLGKTAVNYGSSTYKNDYLSRSVTKDEEGEIKLPLGYDSSGHKLNYFSVDGDAPVSGLGFKEFYNMSNSGSKALDTVLYDRVSYGMPWRPSIVLDEVVLTSTAPSYVFDIGAWQTANPTTTLSMLAGMQYYVIAFELLVRSTGAVNLDDMKISTKWYGYPEQNKNRQDLYTKNATSYVGESVDSFAAQIPGSTAASGIFATVRTNLSMNNAYYGGAPIKTEFQCARSVDNIVVGSRFNMFTYTVNETEQYRIPSWVKFNLVNGDFAAGSIFRTILAPQHGEIF